MNIKLIKYREIDRLNISDTDFIEIETTAISPVISEGYNELFKSEIFDRNSFREQVFNLLTFDNLPKDFAIDNLTLFCQFKGHKIKCHGCLYLKNIKILLLKFNSSPNFDAWIDALTINMWTDEGIVMKLRDRQFSVATALPEDSITDFAKFIKSNAPKQYSKRKQQAINRQFIKNFQVLDSMKQSLDLTITQQLWQDFLDGNTNASKQPNIKTNPNCDRHSLASFTKKIGYDLPEELAVLYKLDDGIEKAFFSFDFMPLAETIKTWRNWKKIFNDWTLEELMGNSFGDRDRTIGMYTNPRWIAFIDLFGGNYIGIDLMPGKAGKIGQIIMFGADIDCITCLADNLNHFLSLCIALQKNPELENPLQIVFNI